MKFTPIPLKKIATKIGTNNVHKTLVYGIAVDSRLVQPGDLFFALPGDKVDGHSFIHAAALAGASGAVVKHGYEGQDFGLPLLLVEDVLVALQKLSKSILEERKSKVIAVTGSLGKTTTKDFLLTLLRKKFKVSASPGNSNSQIGLPLAILNHTSADDELIILEMGMTHPGQIKKLVEIAKPEIAVVTTVALVHAENFDSLEEIAKSKAEIFSHSATKLGIYHADSDINSVLKNSGYCRKQSFSTVVPADFCLCKTKDGFNIEQSGKKSPLFPPLDIPGEHNYHNFLAAATVARNLGIDWEEISLVQSELCLPEKRLQHVEKNGVLFVNDAYNATELSMKKALDSLPAPQLGCKKIAFLGGMVELGKFSEGCHRAVGRHALQKVDLMMCFGIDCLPIVEEWKQAKRAVIWAKTREQLVLLLQEQLREGDVVLLKGSRAKNVFKVLDEIV
jgi:UDP-N-acetylmuramoyl-tripeptide--D-alanyl-D-alanine ligase